jgi:hypothetical protein
MTVAAVSLYTLEILEWLNRMSQEARSFRGGIFFATQLLPWQPPLPLRH